MLRTIGRLSVSITLVLVPAIAAFGQAATPIETNYEQLAQFGTAVRTSNEYKDNIYIYRDICRQILDATDSYAGATLKFIARVERISLSEVFIEFDDAGDTRIILRHLEPPLYGNNSTLRYNGPPSTIRRQFLAKPVGLRIGSEIDLAVARRLRADNALIMSATIEKMQVRLAPPAFESTAFATLVDWKVLEVRESVLEAKEYLRGY